MYASEEPLVRKMSALENLPFLTADIF